MAEILEVTLSAKYENQLFVNRWNYRAEGDEPPEGFTFGLNDAMGFHPVGGVPTDGTILDEIATMVGANCAFYQAICINPYDPADFDAQPFVPQVTGADGGTPAAPFLAVGFRTNQVRRDIRRATKRFGGITEGAMDAGGAIGSATAAFALELAVRMSAVLTYEFDTSTATYTPCVVKKEKYTVPGSDPERFAYRYITPHDETGLALQLADIATGFTWEPYSDVRSQVSRQYGRGI